MTIFPASKNGVFGAKLALDKKIRGNMQVHISIINGGLMPTLNKTPTQLNILGEWVEVKTPTGSWFGNCKLFKPGSILLQVPDGEDAEGNDSFQMVQINSQEMVIIW